MLTLLSPRPRSSYLLARSIGVVIGLVFLEPAETPAGIQTLKTLCYMQAPAFYYLSIIVSRATEPARLSRAAGPDSVIFRPQLAVFLLCNELVVFDREREDNIYSTGPWVISTILSYAPINILSSTLYSVIVCASQALPPFLWLESSFLSFSCSRADADSPCRLHGRLLA